jgi:HK97 family phage major capsid protein
MNELEQKLSALQTELKTYFDKAAEEKKNQGTMLETTKAAIDGLQKQVDAIDVKLAEKQIQDPGGQVSGIEKAIMESESMQRLLKDRRGSAVLHLKGRDVATLMERKTTITGTATGAGLAAVGTATSGVLPIQRVEGGIVPEGRYQLRVRDVLTARPTTAAVIDFVKVLAAPTIASPVVEASTKPENAATFTTASEKVRTLATWIPATRQVLDDMPELQSYITSALPYYVNKMEELQLLSGDGTGENLHGIIPQATAFNTALLTASAGWQRLDIIGQAIGQIMTAAETDPTFVVLNSVDWWKLRLTKDAYGHYILGDPQGGATNPQIWGPDVVPTTAIALGTFVVGSGSIAASEIRDRMEMQVEISTEHADFFVKNLIAIRAEKRLAYVVKRPASFISGTFTTSP